MATVKLGQMEKKKQKNLKGELFIGEGTRAEGRRGQDGLGREDIGE